MVHVPDYFNLAAADKKKQKKCVSEVVGARTPRDRAGSASKRRR